MISLSRRRFLTIAAASATLPAASLAAAGAAATWRGRAMGAHVSMQLAGLSQAQAAPVFVAVEQELLRLENIFSLYRTESEISRLNRDGVLAAPSHELLELLSLSDRLHRASDGAFDPSIQPLWLAMANGETGAALDTARQSVGWHHLRFDAGEVRFERAGQGLTLNGIAQGYVTDRITALLKTQGLSDVLVDMGEIAALGQGPDGANWKVGVAGADGQVVKRLQMRDRALATSAPMGTQFDGWGHIMTPDGGAAAANMVSVSANHAALADGLSTTLCLLPSERAKALVSSIAGARIEYSA